MILNTIVLHNTIYAQRALDHLKAVDRTDICLLYTSPSPRDS